MTHFVDHLQTIKRHAFDMAIIVDSKGEKAGAIIVRYTQGRIGYNHEIAVALYGDNDLHYENTKKGDQYDHDDLYRHLIDNGATAVYDENRLRFIDRGAEESPVNRYVDGVSRITEFASFKFDRKTYRIYWV